MQQSHSGRREFITQHSGLNSLDCVAVVGPLVSGIFKAIYNWLYSTGHIIEISSGIQESWESYWERIFFLSVVVVFFFSFP